jgi:hypothetical protein
MSRLVALGIILGTAALGGCGGDNIVSSPPPPPLVPNALSIVAGDSQSANVGRYLPKPLVVSVTTPGGVAGVGGVTVAWTVTTGGGTLSASSVLTDAQGRATVYWSPWPPLSRGFAAHQQVSRPWPPHLPPHRLSSITTASPGALRSRTSTAPTSLSSPFGAQHPPSCSRSAARVEAE